MVNLIVHNKALLRENRDVFFRTFEVPLTRFMHPLLGFDVVAFDDWLGTPDGISTSDHILAKYGEPARELVFKLIA